MSERLYLVNDTLKQFICIGKEFSRKSGYELGNVDILGVLLKYSNSTQSFSIVKEDDFESIEDYENMNTANYWIRYDEEI